MMQRLFLFLLLPTLFFSCSPPRERWVRIFNGEDLEGWTVKITGHPAGENYQRTFRAEDGLLRVDYSEYDSFRYEFGHIFYQEELQYFKLRFEYRFLGDPLPGTPDWAIRNSGVMIHSQSPQSMNLDQAFPVSLEVQLLGGYPDAPGRSRPTGNLCTPGLVVRMGGAVITEHCISSIGPTIQGDEWVQAEVVAAPDGRFYHLINGDTVITYTDPMVGGSSLPYNYPVGDSTPVIKGYISFQSEGHPVEFRNIELLDLGE
jgi:hypothetical protein